MSIYKASSKHRQWCQWKIMYYLKYSLNTINTVESSQFPPYNLFQPCNRMFDANKVYEA